MSIEYEFQTRPDDGETMAVADGIRWLRMPLPFSLNHINLWLLRDNAGWVIVDSGLGDRATQESWHSVFQNDMQGDPATHVVATHLHPDHVGCAGFLVRHFDVDFWMARDEYMLCRILVADTGRDAPDEGVRFYRAAGYNEEQIEKYRREFGFFGKMVTPLPEAYKRLSDGDEVAFAGATWRIITGGGHSPEHACLYNADINTLIAGDQLLPTISPNVGVWPTEPKANPLKDWFASFEHLKKHVPEDVLVLPAHGKPFRGAHARIDALVAEHGQRLDTLLDNLSEPKRVVDLFEPLFRSAINDGNRMMATGETLSHLNYLVEAGQVTRETKNGVAHYLRNAA